MMVSSPTSDTPQQPYSSTADYALEEKFAEVLDTHRDALNQAMASAGPEEEDENGIFSVFRTELHESNEDKKAHQDGGFARLVREENWDGMNLAAGVKAFYDHLDPIKKPLLHPVFRDIDLAIRDAREKGGAEEMCDLVGARIAPIVGIIRRGQQ